MVLVSETYISFHFHLSLEDFFLKLLFMSLELHQVTRRHSPNNLFQVVFSDDWCKVDIIDSTECRTVREIGLTQTQ